MFLRIIIYFFNIHISRIYYVSYPIIFKINVSTYQIRIVSDTCIVSMHPTANQWRDRGSRGPPNFFWIFFIYVLWKLFCFLFFELCI